MLIVQRATWYSKFLDLGSIWFHLVYHILISPRWRGFWQDTDRAFRCQLIRVRGGVKMRESRGKGGCMKGDHGQGEHQELRSWFVFLHSHPLIVIVVFFFCPPLHMAQTDDL
jgi:hypothetical protein